jgi:hypothetical protein
MHTPTFLLPLTLLVASSVTGLAQADDILANTATFKPKVTISDIYSDRIVTIRDGSDVTHDIESAPERVSLSITANLDGFDLSTIDGDTYVTVTAGHFEHADSLANAADYKPGAKKATFALTADVDQPDGSTKTVRVGSVTYAWTPKVLTITITCTDIVAAGLSDVAASDYMGIADPGTSEAITNDPIDLAVAFGDAAGDRRIFLKGFSKVTTKKFGSEAAGTYEEFDLTDVNVQGAADVAGPVVKATFPAKQNSVNKIDVAGSATDLEDVTLDSVTVNNVAAADAVVTIADPEADGSWDWSVKGVQLKKGANKVVLTFLDEDGNATAVTKTYTIK